MDWFNSMLCRAIMAPCTAQAEGRSTPKREHNKQRGSAKPSQIAQLKEYSWEVMPKMIAKAMTSVNPQGLCGRKESTLRA